MSASDSYSVLTERLGFPNSQRLRPILEYLMTPEVARMVEALPGTATEVAAATGFDADRVYRELDNLFFKGAVFTRGDYSQRQYFRFARSIMQLHDATEACKDFDHVKDRKFFELWDDFVTHEMAPQQAKQVETRYAVDHHAGSRVVPAYKAIEGLPGVLPIEDYRELVKAQRRITSVKCSCRYRTTAVDHHCNLVSEEERWNCLQFNRSADYSMARGAGKEFTPEEAVELIGQMEDEGLVHLWRNTTATEGVNSSCNCCRDCCISYVPLDMAGLSVGMAWEKSRYEAYMSSLDACDGCQDCVARCQFDAIEMGRVAGSKRMKAMIDEEKCWGCGSCVVGCKPKALAMKVVRPPEFIPAAAVAAE